MTPFMASRWVPSRKPPTDLSRAGSQFIHVQHKTRSILEGTEQCLCWYFCHGPLCGRCSLSKPIFRETVQFHVPEKDLYLNIGGGVL